MASLLPHSSRDQTPSLDLEREPAPCDERDSMPGDESISAPGDERISAPKTVTPGAISMLLSIGDRQLDLEKQQSIAAKAEPKTEKDAESLSLTKQIPGWSDGIPPFGFMAHVPPPFGLEDANTDSSQKKTTSGRNKYVKLVEWTEPYLSNSRKLHCIMDPDAAHGDGETKLNDNYNVGDVNDFTAGVEIPGLNLADKVDHRQCPSAARQNVKVGHLNEAKTKLLARQYTGYLFYTESFGPLEDDTFTTLIVQKFDTVPAEILEWLRSQHWWEFGEMDFFMLTTAYGQTGDFNREERVLKYMNEKGIPQSAVTFNSLMSFETSYKEVSSIFDQMQRSRIRPGAVLIWRASHVAVECALQSHPNMVFLAEEVAMSKFILFDITKQISDAVQARAEQGKYHGVILIPEGLVESIPELFALLQEIRGLQSQGVDMESISSHLSSWASALFEFLPPFIRKQFLLPPESDNSAQFFEIEIEKLLAQLVDAEMNKRIGDLSSFDENEHKVFNWGNQLHVLILKSAFKVFDPGI